MIMTKATSANETIMPRLTSRVVSPSSIKPPTEWPIRLKTMAGGV
jgi:hypothetical protein